jgi:diguanylate cyclase (GGDEF)-like protein
MAFLNEMGSLMVWGTALLYIDAIAIILLYERLGRVFRRHVIWRFAISGAIVLSFDQAAFYSGLHFLFDAPLSVFFGGWYAKMLAVVIYSVLLLVYLKVEQIPKLALSRREISDIFHDLTFRERYQALLATSGVDRLTGVFDRNRLEADGPGMIKHSIEMGQKLSLVIIDADRFKDVNDLFGHMKGDEVLKNVAAQLKARTRPRDHLSRFGGEEFVLILPNTDHEEALVLSERLRQDICASVLRPDGQCITVSIGVATTPEDGDTFASLLCAADQRLYNAKKDGRDNVHGRQGRLVLPVGADV